MRSPSEPLDSAPAWAPEELGTLVEQVRDDRFFALWMLIATSGVRLEALTGLLREDVDLVEGRIRAPLLAALGDGGPATARRSYALDPTAYATLKKHVAAWSEERRVLRQATQRLFVWSNGAQVDAGTIRTMFRQHCSVAGLPLVPLQSLRQAYVVAAIDSGIPVKEISDRLGRSAEPQTFRTSPRGEGHFLGRRQRTAQSRKGGGPCPSRNY